MGDAGLRVYSWRKAHEPRKESLDILEARKDKKDFALASRYRAVWSKCWAQLSKTDVEVKRFIFIFIYGIS